MAISKLPDELPKPVKPTKVVSEKKIQEFINKGGKPTKEGGGEETPESNGTKSLKLVLTDQEMSAIKTLRSKRPSRRRKIPISLQNWVVEAVQEKIKREQKKYGLTLI